MALVPQRSPVGPETGWRNRLGHPVRRDSDLPLVAEAVLGRFDQRMVVMAQQDEVSHPREDLGARQPGNANRK